MLKRKQIVLSADHVEKVLRCVHSSLDPGHFSKNTAEGAKLRTGVGGTRPDVWKHASVQRTSTIRADCNRCSLNPILETVTCCSGMKCIRSETEVIPLA